MSEQENNFPADESENNAFVIGEGEMQAPADMVNASEAPVPDGAGLAPLPDLPGLPEEEPSSELLDLPESMDVDDMLASALNPEETSAVVAPAPEAPLASSTPTFGLVFPALSASERAVASKISAEMGVELPASASPFLSRLSEFQAASILQACVSHGLVPKLTLHFPEFSPSEDSTALGDLAIVPDLEQPKQEGAPSVPLARGENDVMLLVESSAFPVQETLGIVTAHRSLARRFFREDESEAKLQQEMLQAGGKSLPSSRFQAVMREISKELKMRVLERGGNALLGAKIEVFPESSSLDPANEQMRLVAFGTAAVVEKANIP